MAKWSGWLVAATLIVGSVSAQQGTLEFRSDDPGTLRPYKFDALAARDLQRTGATAADAQAFAARVKQVADLLRNSPVWNPPKGVDVLVSGQATSLVDARPGQPLAGSLLAGSFEHLQIREADGSLGQKFVAGETVLLTVNFNIVPTAGSAVAGLKDDAGAFLKVPSPTGEIGGFPVYGNDMLIVTTPDRQLWAPVSRERYLKAFIVKRKPEAAVAEAYIADQQKKLDAFQTPEAAKARQDKYKAAVEKLASKGASAMEHERAYWVRDEADSLAALVKGASRDPRVSRQAATIAGLKTAEGDLASMPAADRAQQACFVDVTMADPARSGLVAMGTAGCSPVVTMNPEFFDQKAPRGAIQIVTIGGFRDLPKTWKSGRPAAGTSGGSLDAWTTYEVIRTTDWKAVAAMLGK